MSTINYNHSQNLHILDAPSSIFPIINEIYKPESILDVGCGLGTWLKVISESKIEDFFGIDGIELEAKDFFVSKDKFKRYDLTESWNLGRKFDLAICLEVAEHLPHSASSTLIYLLTEHSDVILFSAACPKQPGQGHINCQWIGYWQSLFNNYGYACFDEIRPRIWNQDFPEWWYKQNMFIAKRSPENAGKESRILSMVHPDLYTSYVEDYLRSSYSHNSFLNGDASFRNYLQLLVKATQKFISRKLKL